MFGYIIINKGDMKFREFDVYHSYYCGLCQALKEKYGKLGQISLSYDITFLVMLLGSLYEPETEVSEVKCMAHPFEKHILRKNEFSYYGADRNLLSLYTCKDDWEDESKLTRLAYMKMVKKAYCDICVHYGEKTRKISSLMRELAQEEKRQNQDIDHMAGLFGEIMAEMMTPKNDEWSSSLRHIGNNLGKFIYILDAYEDIVEDIKKGRFKPLRKRYENPEFEEEIKTILTMIMAECCKEFEKLPVIENVEILRNILYSGIWCRFDMVSQAREGKKAKEKGAENARSI